MLNNLAKEIHENSKKKGFYDDSKNTGEMIALMHSELSEALEADRNNIYAQDINDLNCISDNKEFIYSYENEVKGSFQEEMADIIIRVLDMCAFKGIDVEYHIKLKMRYNSLRSYKHGKKY